MKKRQWNLVCFTENFEKAQSNIVCIPSNRSFRRKYFWCFRLGKTQQWHWVNVGYVVKYFMRSSAIHIILSWWMPMSKILNKIELKIWQSNCKVFHIHKVSIQSTRLCCVEINQWNLYKMAVAISSEDQRTENTIYTVRMWALSRLKHSAWTGFFFLRFKYYNTKCDILSARLLFSRMEF